MRARSCALSSRAAGGQQLCCQVHGVGKVVCCSGKQAAHSASPSQGPQPCPRCKLPRRGCVALCLNRRRLQQGRSAGCCAAHTSLQARTLTVTLQRLDCRAGPSMRHTRLQAPELLPKVHQPLPVPGSPLRGAAPAATLRRSACRHGWQARYSCLRSWSMALTTPCARQPSQTACISPSQGGPAGMMDRSVEPECCPLHSAHATSLPGSPLRQTAPAPTRTI